MIVIKCFRQSSLLTREHLVFTSTLTNTYKPLAEFVVVDRGSGARCYAWPSTSRATRVTLDVITPSPTALTPEKWKQTATLCPLDWPSNYSLLRLPPRKQMNHRHMFSHWGTSGVLRGNLDHTNGAGRIFSVQTPSWLPGRPHVQSQQKDELQLSCKAVCLSLATKAW